MSQVYPWDRGTNFAVEIGRRAAKMMMESGRVMEYWEKLRRVVGHDTLILSGTGGAIVQDGRILLVRNNEFGKWQIPGGLQEIGESIEACTEREIREELGLDLKAATLISVYSDPKWTAAYPNGDQIQPLAFFFLMKGNFATPALQESEISEARFFTLEEIPDEILPLSRQMVLDWAAFNGKVIRR